MRLPLDHRADHLCIVLIPDIAIFFWYEPLSQTNLIIYLWPQGYSIPDRTRLNQTSRRKWTNGWRNTGLSEAEAGGRPGLGAEKERGMLVFTGVLFLHSRGRCWISNMIGYCVSLGRACVLLSTESFKNSPSLHRKSRLPWAAVRTCLFIHSWVLNSQGHLSWWSILSLSTDCSENFFLVVSSALKYAAKEIFHG